jgi:SAM-dependent methyltransferase
MASWHEEDGFWDAFGPCMFTAERWDAAAGEIEGVLERTGFAPPASILDLACGCGRHSLELARRGFRVTAVDRTAAYLDQGRQRAQEQGLEIEWVQADMRAFSRRDAFNGAINLSTSFGYFADPADDEAVARNLFASLRPGGALVMQMMGKEVVARIFTQRRWREGPDGSVMLEESKIAPGWSWIENRWILLNGPERTEYNVSHRLYSAAELTALLERVGFAAVESFGDLAGSPYDHTARALVIVARK